ncbi:MAG TPA: YihY/virulence factor BrkB family protein [Candidatus Limnocylindrales bacterium]|nr:YihY/virulence factor BrkB family protein [Candidatus Limnocylindrales bacterium]
MTRTMFRSLGRIFPDCVTLGQAIAFNMFLAFFPILLVALGLVTGIPSLHDAIREIPDRLNLILPASSTQVVSDYFLRRGTHPVRWILLGLGGTLIAGSQVMVGFIEGFRMVEGDLITAGYWRRHLRALLLLCVTIIPALAVLTLTIFGKSTRAWLTQRTGAPNYIVHDLAILGYAGVVFVLAMIVLVALYRIGRPGHAGVAAVFPGAAMATILWWLADVIFGFYVRRVPYNVVYGGLAAAIGLLLWMYLTAMIVLFGAAYNAEDREARGEERAILSHQVISRSR